MAGNNKENKEIDGAAAREILLNFLEKRNLWLDKPYKIWVGDPIPVDNLGYFFFAGPYKEGEPHDKHARKVAVEKRTGIVHLACVM